jgi:hypothetical protein
MRALYLGVGGTLVLLGVLGFLSLAPIDTLLAPETPQSVLHLVTGAVTLHAAWRGLGPMRAWGRIAGALYLIVALAAFATTDGNILGIMTVVAGARVLYLGLSVFYLYCALLAPPTL